MGWFTKLCKGLMNVDDSGSPYYKSETLISSSLRSDNTHREDMESIRRLADQGYAPAQYYLGVMYLNGEGVPQDYKDIFARGSSDLPPHLPPKVSTNPR